MMPATSQEPQDGLLLEANFKAGGSGRRKRVSARHQVKRLNRHFGRVRSDETVRQKKLNILIGVLHSVRIQRSAVSPAAFAG
jgi:hypothetical protein